MAALALTAGVLSGPVALAARGADTVIARGVALGAGAHRVPLARGVSFDVVLAPRHGAQLAALAAGVGSPTSPLYRDFVTPAQYARLFAPRAATRRAVRDYFAGAGLRVTRGAGPLILHVSGPSVDAERALSARLVSVRHDGRTETVLRGAARVPAALARAIGSLGGLTSWRGPHVMSPRRPTAAREDGRSPRASVGAPRRSAPEVVTPGTCAAASAIQAGSTGSFLPAQQAAAYGLSAQWAKGHNGSGQTIAVYELAAVSLSDVQHFFNCYGLSPQISVVNVDGGPQGSPGCSNDTCDNSWNAIGEADLDVEEAGVLAPGASIIVYQGSQVPATGGLDTYQAIASADAAGVVTTSWGGCEGTQVSDDDIASEATVFEQMAVQGQSVFASTGDSGSSDCYGGSPVVGDGLALAVDDPSSQPEVTGVGGLSVDSLASVSPPRSLVESVWDAGAGGGASGGGESQVWNTQPAWQSGDGVPTTGHRMVPDVSVMGDPGTGFIEYAPDGSGYRSWGPVGGTSIGSPIMAAVTATADEACGVRLGALNPTLYQLAAAGTGFDDVTSGHNYISSSARSAHEWVAGAGYDMASGLGSPDPGTFIADLCTIAASGATSSLALSPSDPVDLVSGATATLTVRDASGDPLEFAEPTVTATEPGANVQVTAQAPATDANGQISYLVTTDLPGTVSLDFVVGANQIATAQVSFDSSIRVAAAGLSGLGSGTSLATATSTSGAVAVGVTRAHAVLEGSAGSGAPTNLSSRLALTGATGAPAVSCASTGCAAAVDTGGVLTVIANANSPTRASATSLGAVSALARSVAANSLSILEGSTGSYVDVAWLTTSHHVAFAQWRASTGRFVVSDLTARNHLGTAGSGTALMATGAAQAYVATRVGGADWLLRVGASNGATNAATAAGYASANGALVGAPALARDPQHGGALELLSRTATGALVQLGASASAPLSLSRAATLADAGVTAAQFLPGAAGESVLYLKGSAVYLAVGAPDWFSVSVSAVTSVTLVATGLSGGPAPLVATAAGPYAVTA